MATVSWSGSIGGNVRLWNTAGNWYGGTVPGATDTALVTLQNYIITPTLNMQGAVVGTVDLYGGPAVHAIYGNLTANAVSLQGNIMQASGYITAGAAYVTNVNTIQGQISATGAAVVGGAASGTLLITGLNNAYLSGGSLLAGGNAGVTGKVIDTGNGVNIAGSATIGASGTGALTLQ